MATKKKLLQAAAGNAGGAALNVEDVFSTYLNNEGSSDQTITNGIDLAGEGGLVWGKSRNLADGFFLVDSARGKGSNNNFKYLRSDTTSQELDIASRSLSSMNSNGFTFQGADAQFNASGNEYVYWTFRKAEKFFTCLTYTGDGTSGRAIAHDLNSSVGSVIIKRIDTTESWYVWHKGYPSGSLKLNETSAGLSFGLNQYFGGTQPTTSNFYVSSDSGVNNNGSAYVAYLFAHNNGDGQFGPDGDADIIKCGSYTGNGSTPNGPIVDLGFEPQWLLIKNASATANWYIYDAMRGWPVDSSVTTLLRPDTSAAEVGGAWAANNITPTGFQVRDDDAHFNSNGSTYIYIAIRRPTAVPTSATEVFAVDEGDGVGAVSAYTSGFPVDFAIDRTATSTSPNYVATRLLQGKRLQTDGTNAEASESAYYFDYMEGWRKFARVAGNYSWMWKRAPKYFDVVAYTGTSGAQTLNHNLGVTPELIIVKARESSIVWAVWSKSLEQYEVLQLNTSNAKNGTSGDYGYWTSTAPTNTQFSVGTYDTANKANEGMIAYLFATLAGISKVGSATHSGTTNVDCGFTSGARFVLLKRTDASGDWYIWDSTRGIVSGNDPYLLLNSTAAEVTNTDYIDPLSSGFTITSNFTAGDYIFYAIA